MKNLHNKIAIFATSLLATSAAVYMYSPVIKSNAADSSVDVNVEVNPIVSLTLDTNAVNFSITPTSSGVFESKPIVATVDTNSTGGYELYFSSIDENTAMTSLTSESTITSTFADTVTSTTMAANTWGYSLDNTDFSKIPTLTNHVALKNLDHLPSAAEKTTTTNIGVKIDSTLASGTYNKKVLFSAVAHENASQNDSSTMQGFSCDDILVNVGDSTTLTDIRDGNEYTVKKLADGNCWMTENLRLMDIEISSTNSNLPEGESWTIPSSSLTGFNANDTNNAYLDSTYGGYYTFYTVTAGWGSSDMTETRVSSPKDICPKGWRLPTGSVEGEYYTLYEKYSTSELIRGEPGFVLSGYIYDGSIHGQEISDSIPTAYYWSSTADFVNSAYILSFGNQYYVSAMGSNSRLIGATARCIAN